MSSKTQAPPHPMVEVPEAIRLVLETTAKAILSASSSSSDETQYDVISSNAPAAELCGRILFEDVLMSEPGYPPYRASIMDGYAVRCEEYPATDEDNKNDTQWTHQVSHRVHAGPSASSSNNETIATTTDQFLPSAIYVTTGARIPDSYDCVVPIELIQESTDQSTIGISDSATIEPQKWIRDVGCDIAAGSVVLPQGSPIHPVSLGLLQQSGQPEIKVIKKTRVGVLSTGNELLVSTDSWSQQQTNDTGGSSPGCLIQTGQIPDVNKPILLSLLESFHTCVQPIDLGMERDDDIDSMTATLKKALETCDVILTTGGISMGETDIVEDVLVRKLGGTLHFGRLNMKPGKPTTFVTIQKSSTTKKPCLVFALPGNPVSATVCTHLVVRPALEMLLQYKCADKSSSELTSMIENTWVPPEVIATLTHDIKLDMERPEYHRVVLDMKISFSGTTMEYTATSTGVQRSSRLMSLRDAQGLLVLPRGTAQQPKALAGQQYTVLLLDGHHSPVRLKDSKHLNPAPLKLIPLKPSTLKPSPPPTKVAITQITDDTTDNPLIPELEIADRVVKALSGSRSGSVVVQRNETVTGDLEEVSKYFRESLSSASEQDRVDIWVVACSGSFSYCLQISQMLREQVGKIADACALQVRRGAAAQDGAAALFEPVVGFINSQQNGGQEDGCMLVALPSRGLDGGLDNVRGLLKHAVNVARGKPHSHHHKHQH